MIHGPGLHRELQPWEASIRLVDGNPLEDISATERISVLLFKGERINRQALFDQK